jgi:benzylsuccinate CoA-transferase BbsE subunit
MDLAAGNLSGYRVLDLTSEPGFLAGRLLADLGADVIKIEPPEGDAARHRGPFVGGAPDPERSILWLSLNVGKRGVTLALDRSGGRDLFLRLCQTADVVLESERPGSPRSLAARGLGYDALRAADPRLVVCLLSPFGQTGPYSSYRGSDITAVAMGGNMNPTGNPERPPVCCSLPVSYFHGGSDAAVGIVFALWAREETGEGQLVDVSLQEAVVMANMTTPAQFALTGSRGGRAGAHFRGGRAVFREIWRCRDGYVSFALRSGPGRNPAIVRLVEYMAESGIATEELRTRDWMTYNHNLITQDEVDRIEAALGAFFRSRTMQELYDAACERGLMLAPANTAREIMASRQLAAREFFVPIDYPHLGVRLSYPRAVAKSTAGAIGVRRPAPRLGEHNREVYGELGIPLTEQDAMRAAGLI